MKKNLTRTIVFLSDGQELLCANTSEEINTELETNDCVKLILSKPNGGQVLSIHKQHICYLRSASD